MLANEIKHYICGGCFGIMPNHNEDCTGGHVEIPVIVVPTVVQPDENGTYNFDN